MSSTNRRFILAYIILVGLPLLGLGGVLKAGRHLTAPISVDGTWKVEPTSVPADACSKAVSALVASNLVISQSGKTLAMNINGSGKTPFAGSLEGQDISASLGTVSGCSGDQPVTLTAFVNRNSEPKSLTGSLSMANCASCSPVEFRGVLQPKSGGKR